MKLYNFPWGPYPRRLTIYLAEKGISEIDLVEVEFPHRPELWPADFMLGLNPAHSLPVLDLGGDARIGQSVAILEYLEERYTDHNMIGMTPESRAATREMIAVFDEATSFFGLWARHSSHLNGERHLRSLEAARIGAERYSSKLRVAEAMTVGPFLCGGTITIADCVAMALIEFADQFYGAELPVNCPKLANWYARFADRPSAKPPIYPVQMLKVARGLPEQSGCNIAIAALPIAAPAADAKRDAEMQECLP